MGAVQAPKSEPKCLHWLLSGGADDQDGVAVSGADYDDGGDGNVDKPSAMTATNDCVEVDSRIEVNAGDCEHAVK